VSTLGDDVPIRLAGDAHREVLHEHVIAEVVDGSQEEEADNAPEMEGGPSEDNMEEEVESLKREEAWVRTVLDQGNDKN
jgi:hypothetical protein